jgi:hypothetical protein
MVEEYDVILVEGQFNTVPIDLEWLDPAGVVRNFSGFDSLMLYINDRDLETLIKTIVVTDEGSGILRWTIADGDVPVAGRYTMVYVAKDGTSAELPSQHLRLLVKKKGQTS